MNFESFYTYEGTHEIGVDGRLLGGSSAATGEKTCFRSAALSCAAGSGLARA